jgi:hypothetical protein
MSLKTNFDYILKAAGPWSQNRHTHAEWFEVFTKDSESD